MPVTPTYPGVYIEEIPSGVRTITGVATSIAAFVGYFTRGPMDEAVQIFNMGDFEREFGGLNSQSEASYAIQQFFLNGGTEASVVRTASGEVRPASVEILDSEGGLALAIAARQSGTWGDNLQINIDYPTPVSDNRFTMTVSLVETVNSQPVIARSEVFNGLTTSTVMDVVNDEFLGSKLVRVTAVGNDRPAQTGTVSGDLSGFSAITSPKRQLNVKIGSASGITRLSDAPTLLSDARAYLEQAIRAARPDLRAFSQATVSIVDNSLRILAGPTDARNRVIFLETEINDSTAERLGLVSEVRLQGILSANLSEVDSLSSVSGDLNIEIGDSDVTLTLNLSEVNDLDGVRDVIEEQIHAANNTEAFENARVITYRNEDTSEERLIVLAGIAETSVVFTPVPGNDDSQSLMDNLGLSSSGGSPPAASIVALVSDQILNASRVVAGDCVDVAFGEEENSSATVVIASSANTLEAIAVELETAMRDAADANASFTDARVASYESGASGLGQLVILSGVAGESVGITPFVLQDNTFEELNLNENAIANVQSYVLGGEAIGDTAQGDGTRGDDGDPPDALALIAGIEALQTVDLVNILCIPRASLVTGDEALPAEAATAVLVNAKNFCEDRRAFLLVDTPSGIKEVQAVKDWLDNLLMAGLRSRNAALYFPRVSIPDPLNDFKLRSVGASGTIAGLYARTDSDRGVWKAPAGTEATLNNVFRLDKTLTDPENGTLNKVAINGLRTFPIYGSICWGARTLDGADDIGSEWKYVPVRRLALFMEESLFRGLKWVVFEPNDEPLWAQIRLNVGAFMNTLFRQGAFQGTTPREAYLVKCDKETTTQDDINRGIVNILVGFAPLKPAEFVFIKLQQLAGQLQT